MRVFERPRIECPDYVFQRQRCQSGGSRGAILGKSTATGTIGTHHHGANALRSFTALDLFLRASHHGSLAGFLRGDAKVVVAGFGDGWHELLLPYRSTPLDPVLEAFLSEQLHRLAKLFPQKYSFSDAGLTIKGGISPEERTLLLWALSSCEERRALDRLIDTPRGISALGIEQIETVIGVDWGQENIETAQRNLSLWLDRSGSYPAIPTDRYYEGGNSEQSYWYASTYRLDDIRFDGARLLNRISLLQADAGNLSDVANDSIRLYCAFGLLEPEVFVQGSETPIKIVREAIRVLERSGILFTNQNERSLAELGVLSLLMERCELYPIVAGRRLHKDIFSQLVAMGILTEKEYLPNLGVWIKRDGPGLGFMPPAEEQKAISNRPNSNALHSEVWESLDVLPVGELLFDGEVEYDAALAKEIRERGFFTEPILVDRQTRRVIDGRKRLAIARKWGCIGIPVTFNPPRSAPPIRVKNLFFPLEKLFIPLDSQIGLLELRGLCLASAKRHLSELRNSPLFSFEEEAFSCHNPVREFKMVLSAGELC